MIPNSVKYGFINELHVNLGDRRSVNVFEVRGYLEPRIGMQMVVGISLKAMMVETSLYENRKVTTGWCNHASFVGHIIEIQSPTSFTAKMKPVAKGRCPDSLRRIWAMNFEYDDDFARPWVLRSMNEIDEPETDHL